MRALRLPTISLTTRMAISVIAVLSFSAVIGTRIATDTLRASVYADIAQQQSSTVSNMAAHIESDLRVRLDALTLSASALNKSLFKTPGLLQSDLESRPVLQSLFNRGSYITDTKGIAIASAPANLDRLGRSFIDRDYVVSALKEGKSVISNPLIARTMGAPIIAISVPIFSGSDVVGAWVGAIDLRQPNFLDVFTNSQYGRAGSFLLVAPDSRRIITATDKSRILEQLPPQGVNAGVDRFIRGDFRTNQFINPVGVEVIASAAAVPISGWYVAAALPVKEAFAPIEATTKQLWFGAGLLALLSAALMYWILWYQLRPLSAATKLIVNYRPGDPPPTMPKTSEGEVREFFQHLDLLTHSIETQRVEIATSEGRLRKIVESSMLGIFFWDVDGAITDGNSAFSQISGYSPQELKSKVVNWRDITPPEYKARDEEALAEVARDGACKIYGKALIRKDGSRFPIEICGATLPGEVLNGVAFVIDISARKSAESERRSLEEQLREAQKMEAIGTLAGGIAHDFNNILAAILGNTELARQDTVGQPTVQRSLDEIRKAGTRARDLVQQILTFGRRQRADFKPLELSTIVTESARLLRATLPARIEIQTTIVTPSSSVMGEATQLQQVLINLCTNSSQAMSGAPGKISISLQELGPGRVFRSAATTLALEQYRKAQSTRILELMVADTGCGMDDDTVKRIFEPFFTTKPVGEGTGLGLSVAYGIVQRHGGIILVDSAPDKGTTFAIYLPMSEVSHQEAPSSDSRRVLATDNADDGAPVRLLYLDDDESMIFLVERLLERRNIKVSGFYSQAAAIEAVRSNPSAFDLVVTDYNMPGLSGLDVAAELLRIRPNLPVAIASGFVDERLRDAATEVGVVSVIFKAADVEDFCDQIDALGQGRGHRAPQPH